MTPTICCAVWDSSIVMAKYFEAHAEQLRGKRCLDLSAGCGLVGVSYFNLSEFRFVIVHRPSSRGLASRSRIKWGHSAMFLSETTASRVALLK